MDVSDLIEAFFEDCLRQGQIDEDYSDWVHQFTDSTAWDSDLDADDLIDLADEGMEAFGGCEINDHGGFRNAISAMAYYGYTSRVTSEIYDFLFENDLEGEEKRISKKDPHDSWYDEKDGVYLYFDEDDEYEFWELREVKIGSKTIEFWIDVTDEHSLSNITRMRRAVERGQEEED